MIKIYRLKRRFEKSLQTLIKKLPEPIRMAPHNMISLPLMEFFSWLGKEELADWVHKVTIPPEEVPHENLSIHP